MSPPRSDHRPQLLDMNLEDFLEEYESQPMECVNQNSSRDNKLSSSSSTLNSSASSSIMTDRHINMNVNTPLPTNTTTSTNINPSPSNNPQIQPTSQAPPTPHQNFGIPGVSKPFQPLENLPLDAWNKQILSQMQSMNQSMSQTMMQTMG